MDPGALAFLLFIFLMGSLILATIGMFKDDCSHQWPKWTNITINTEFGKSAGQTRSCEKCNKMQTRFVRE